jgi:hypothetical protein
MSPDFLHNHPQFPELIRIVARERAIDPALIEKDYWIMHCLYGLQQLGMTFELKGGTSLSKGFHIINRFSEDIDIRIDPPKDRDVKTGRNQDSPAQVRTRCRQTRDEPASSFFSLLTCRRQREIALHRYMPKVFRNIVSEAAGFLAGVLITPGTIISLSIFVFRTFTRFGFLSKAMPISIVSRKSMSRQFPTVGFENLPPPAVQRGRRKSRGSPRRSTITSL